VTTLTPSPDEALSPPAGSRATGWAPRGWRQFLPPAQPLRISDGELAVLMVCTLVTTIGLAADIARHLLDDVENLQGDFLSGWHLVLYGGVASVGAWIALGALRRGPAFVGSVPTTTIGFLTLTVGGVADAAWHEAFGTEQAVEALVSPPHLIVFAGLVFLLTSPLALLWPRPVNRLGPLASVAAVVSVVSALLVASLFTGFLSPMAGGLSLQAGYIEPLVGESMQEYDQVRGLGVVLWSPVLILSGFVILLGRFRVTPGLLLLGMAVLGVPPVVLAGRSSVPVLVGFVAAGVVLELGVALTARPTLRPVAAAAVSAAVGSTLWAATFLALRAESRLYWSETMVAGSVMLAGMGGAAVAALVMVRVGPVAEPPSDPAGAPVATPAGEPVVEPMVESMVEPMVESMVEPMGEGTAR
jgi:hypothetical protein